MIRTMLEIKKTGMHNGVLQTRVMHRDFSRSFTKHLMEGLYVTHANILTGSPLSVADIFGSTAKLVDGDANASSPAGFAKSTLRIAAPTGRSSITLFDGSGNNSYFPTPGHFSNFPGHLIGIQIGTDNTAPTPGDNRLVARVPHGVGAAAGPGVIDQWNTGDTTDLNANGQGANYAAGMWWTPLRTMQLTTIQFKVWVSGTPGNQTAYLYQLLPNGQGSLNTDAAALATSGAISANGWGGTPGGFQTFTFGAPATVYPGCLYYLCFGPQNPSGGNYCVMRYQSGIGAIRHGLTTTVGAVPPNSNTIGSINNVRMLYIATGNVYNEMDYGACDLYGYTVANPNASFTIRRIFTNNSGNAITVQESGIYAPLSRYLGQSGWTYADLANTIVCIARDTFGGIAVANGETLEVDYTPSIHV